MHVFLVNLISVLLALHTVLGCCWHHAHGCTAGCAASESMVSSDAHSHECAHDDHAAAADSHEPGHHGRHDCRGSTCVFVVSSNLHCHNIAFPAGASFVASMPAGILSDCKRLDGGTSFPPDALLPPLRLHLVCQVLLI